MLMSTNEEILKRITDALKERVGNRAVICPVCGNQSWSLGDSYAVLSISEKLTEETRKGFIPLVPVMCKRCGNTQFINLLILGFKEEEFESLGYSRDVRK